MAQTKLNMQAQSAEILKEIRSGIFRPIYLLMGDEPYYPELVCSEILKNCIDESAKDFNETVCYGADVSAAQLVTAARRFPMMSDRQLVVVREAQSLKNIEELAAYCEEPLDSTVLVLLFHRASLDKRKALYKLLQKKAFVMESAALRDYEIAQWISSYFASKGLSIEPEASELFGESAGTDLSTIVVETEKLLKNLPEGSTKISVQDIEKNVGVSRQFSVFELTRAFSYRNAQKAVQIASRLGTSAKFQIVPAMGALFTHFNRILRYAVLLSRGGYPTAEQKAEALSGMNPYLYKEYDAAVRNYPLPKAMAAVSLLCEYDYKSKGGDGVAADPAELLMELTLKLLNI